MAKVCFRTNVGSVDARRFDLGDDLAKLLKGAELNVSDAVAKKLQDAHIADPVATTGSVKAVPAVEVKT